MKAGPLVCCAALCLAGSVAACDHFLFLTARLPLVAPVDSGCIKRFDLDQVVQRESLTYLVTGTVKINQRFAHGESEQLGRLFGVQLMRARDACGGHSPAAKGLTINSDDPPAEIWSVKGAAGAVWMRWTAESLSWTLHFPTGKGHYVLQVDTVPVSANFQYTTWLPVDRLGIPPPPSGYVFATDCSRDGSPGTLVGFARDADGPFYSGLSSLWGLDLTTLHLGPADTAGVRCPNPKWRSRLPAASHDLQVAALTFAPTLGKARVYVYSPASIRPWPTIPRIMVDSQIAGQLDPGTFLMVEVVPGRRRVEASSGGAILLDVVADSVYFVTASWKRGVFKNHTTLRLSPASKGRPAIAESQMVRSVTVPLEVH
jgi:hypothetical protein